MPTIMVREVARHVARNQLTAVGSMVQFQVSTVEVEKLVAVEKTHNATLSNEIGADTKTNLHPSIQNVSII